MLPRTAAQFSLQAVISVTVALLLLLIIVYFTGPGRDRLIGAIAGGLVFVVLNITWDIAAYSAGWWHYPFTTDPYAPLWVYVAQDSQYGAGVALIGWRIQRRFGMRGLLIFLLLFSGVGTIRDNAYAAFTHVIVFGPGVTPLLADWACWITLLLLAQLTMRMLAGPSHVE